MDTNFMRRAAKSEQENPVEMVETYFWYKQQQQRKQSNLYSVEMCSTSFMKLCCCQTMALLSVYSPVFFCLFNFSILFKLFLSMYCYDV